jgi:alanine racemase
MVKANAYGMGAVRVSRALETLEPWGFGVATVEEGIELRRAAIGRPLLVLTPTGPELEAVYREHDLTAVLDDPVVAAAWSGPFHLEVDTGMGRCGVRWDDAARLRGCAAANMEGVFTHFYAADEGPQTVVEQWERFRTALGSLGERPRLVHAANSAAVWRMGEPLDLVRPGIFLYGGLHAADLEPPRPVAALKAPVVSVRRLPAGESVSYGGEWSAPADTVIATVGIGYADGVPRACEGRAEVLLGGRRRPLVGRVTMDFVMVDLGADGGGVSVGDVATLVGSDGGEAISIDEFASWSGTVSYEALTSIGARVPRIYPAA